MGSTLRAARQTQAGTLGQPVQERPPNGLHSRAGLQLENTAFRMRSNQAGVALADSASGGGSYHRPITDVAGTGSPYIVQKTACIGNVAAATGCLPGDMADQDSYEWQQAVKARLGSGVAIVCRDSSNSTGKTVNGAITHACDGIGPRYSIKIYWLDERAREIVDPNKKYLSFLTTFIP